MQYVEMRFIMQKVLISSVIYATIVWSKSMKCTPSKKTILNGIYPNANRDLKKISSVIYIAIVWNKSMNVTRVNTHFYIESIPMIMEILRSDVSEILTHEILTSYMLMLSKRK